MAFHLWCFASRFQLLAGAGLDRSRSCSLSSVSSMRRSMGKRLIRPDPTNPAERRIPAFSADSGSYSELLGVSGSFAGWCRFPIALLWLSCRLPVAFLSLCALSGALAGNSLRPSAETAATPPAACQVPRSTPHAAAVNLHNLPLTTHSLRILVSQAGNSPFATILQPSKTRHFCLFQRIFKISPF